MNHIQSQSPNYWETGALPRKDWRLVDLEDVEGDHELCQMCGRAFIRHVHTMEHPEFLGQLRVGRRCAAKMQMLSAKERAKIQTAEDLQRAERWENTNWVGTEGVFGFKHFSGYFVTVKHDPQHPYAPAVIEVWNEHTNQRAVDAYLKGSFDEATDYAFEFLEYCRMHF